MGNIFQYILAVALVFGIPILINVIKARDAKETTKVSEKRPEDMTPAEKRKKLAFIESAYRHGDLTFAQYDALKARYSGTESIGSIIAETAGADAAKEFGSKIDKANATERAKKEMTKKVIMNAAIGDAVAGPAGAVIGAMTALNEEKE